MFKEVFFFHKKIKHYLSHQLKQCVRIILPLAVLQGSQTSGENAGQTLVDRDQMVEEKERRDGAFEKNVKETLKLMVKASMLRRVGEVEPGDQTQMPLLGKTAADEAGNRNKIKKN